jgi:hypothetical protein
MGRLANILDRSTVRQALTRIHQRANPVCIQFDLSNTFALDFGVTRHARCQVSGTSPHFGCRN